MARPPDARCDQSDRTRTLSAVAVPGEPEARPGRLVVNLTPFPDVGSKRKLPVPHGEVLAAPTVGAFSPETVRGEHLTMRGEEFASRFGRSVASRLAWSFASHAIEQLSDETTRDEPLVLI